jgi:hypothetical protein
MEDDEIDATIKSLHEKVNQITITSTSTSTSTIVSADAKNTSVFSSSILKSRIIYYCVIPLIIFLLLLFWKPWFIMEDISIDGKLPEKKLSYKKLFIATFIVTFIIAICIFSYFYKNKKDIETIRNN